MAKTTYRLSNWSQYNQALVQRGRLTFWISEEAIEAWSYDGPPQQGAQYAYSDLAIESCLRLRLVYDLPLRQTQGFVISLFELMVLDLPVPDYTTLSRRQQQLSVDLLAQQNDGAQQNDEAASPEPRHIVLDASGLKGYGEGEWKQRPHGKRKRRTWRKIHIGVDPQTGEITAECLTKNDQHDASQVEALLEQTLDTVARSPMSVETGPTTNGRATRRSRPSRLSP